MGSAQARAQLARWGEEAAASFLRGRGFAILHRRYRCPAGEIDLVCRDGAVLVFVEVKTRAARGGAGPETGPAPEEAVGPLKASRLRQAARHFLYEHRLGAVPCRFDVVAVEVGLVAGGPPRIRHLVGAIG